MEFGEKIRTARQMKGLSQKELANLSGVTLRTISNYETGGKRPKSRDQYDKLAKALDLDVSVLLDENAEFIMQASDEYGDRGRKQAEQLIADVAAFYAGGSLNEDDMDAMMRALQEAYWEAKRVNRKFVPKKYRK